MSTSTVKRSWLRNLINIITAIVAWGAEMFSVIFRQYLGMRIHTLSHRPTKEQPVKRKS